MAAYVVWGVIFGDFLPPAGYFNAECLRELVPDTLLTSPEPPLGVVATTPAKFPIPIFTAKVQRPFQKGIDPCNEARIAPHGGEETRYFFSTL